MSAFIETLFLFALAPVSAAIWLLTTVVHAFAFSVFTIPLMLVSLGLFEGSRVLHGVVGFLSAGLNLTTAAGLAMAGFIGGILSATSGPGAAAGSTPEAIMGGFALLAVLGVVGSVRQGWLAVHHLRGRPRRPRILDVISPLVSLNPFQFVQLAIAWWVFRPQPAAPSPFEPIDRLPQPGPSSWDFAGARTIAMRPSLDEATVGIPLR